MIQKAVSPKQTILKFWISNRGERIGAGDSHETAALRVLPAATVEQMHGDYPAEAFTDAVYAAMFARHYMRVSVMTGTPTSVFVDAEYARNIADLPQPQRDWVAGQIAAGHQLQFNNSAYVETRASGPRANMIVDAMLVN